MNPQAQFCQNSACHASGRVGGGNIVIHSQKQKRYKCKCCGKTFTESKGRAVYGLKKSVELFELVVTLLALGCPVQAIVAACGLDERTVLAWQLKAGQHCQGVHEQIVGQSQLDLVQVQADELRVKTQFGVVWMAMAMMVSTRLWLGGAVSPRRGQGADCAVGRAGATGGVGSSAAAGGRRADQLCRCLPACLSFPAAHGQAGASAPGGLAAHPHRARHQASLCHWLLGRAPHCPGLGLRGGDAPCAQPGSRGHQHRLHRAAQRHPSARTSARSPAAPARLPVPSRRSKRPCTCKVLSTTSAPCIARCVSRCSSMPEAASASSCSRPPSPPGSPTISGLFVNFCSLKCPSFMNRLNAAGALKNSPALALFSNHTFMQSYRTQIFQKQLVPICVYPCLPAVPF